MKLHSLLLLTHTVTAAVAGMAVAGGDYLTGLPLQLASAAAVFAAVAGCSLVLARRFRNGLAVLRSAVVEAGLRDSPSTGIEEYDRTALELAEHALRWEEIAANGQEQSRDVAAILALLNRRGGGPAPSTSELRQVLAGIGHALSARLEQLDQGTHEAARCTEAIADGAEAEGDAVVKAGTYVDQLSDHIERVSAGASQVQEAIVAARESTGEASGLVRELIEGMDRIRMHSEASEKKLRGLGDPSRQISAIVGTIGDIAARTDLLALNASIESIRAGEHGRGFAVVAEEVRKLAEQAAQASREIAGLVESMQLATQESIAGIAEERSEVESEMRVANAADEMLRRTREAADDGTRGAGEIASTARQQLQLLQDIASVVEQIANLAKASRSGAENACWTMKALTAVRQQIDAAIDPLKRCAEKRRADLGEPTAPNQSGDASGETDGRDESHAPRSGAPQLPAPIDRACPAGDLTSPVQV